MPRTPRILERCEGKKLMRSLLFPFNQKLRCRYLILIKGLQEVLYNVEIWLIDNIEQTDYYLDSVFARGSDCEIEFRRQEDMNLFMLSWAGRCKIEILVNEPK